MREDVQILVAEVDSGFDHMPAFNKGPVVAHLERILDLLKRVPERVLAQVEKVISRAAKRRLSEIDRTSGNTRNTEQVAGNVSGALQIAQAARVRIDVAGADFVHHTRTQGPRIVQHAGLRFDGVGYSGLRQQAR